MTTGSLYSNGHFEMWWKVASCIMQGQLTNLQEQRDALIST